MMKYLSALAWGVILLLSAEKSSAQNSSSDSASRARMHAAMAAAKARADSGALLVKKIVVSPQSLELDVGKQYFSQDVWEKLRIVGVTAAGDTLTDFSKFLALEPNPYLTQSGTELTGAKAGVATLWIYIGTPTGALFVPTDRATRVELKVR